MGIHKDIRTQRSKEKQQNGDEDDIERT